MKFRLTHWFAWVALGVAVVLLNRYTGVDQALSNLFYDPQLPGFPLKQHAMLSHVLHDGLRVLAAGLWLLLLALCLVAAYKRQPQAREWAFVLITSVVAAVVVSVVKSKSAHSCPWDLTLYGGVADYFRVFDPVSAVLNPGPGKCFPSGHASVAFMWLVLLYSPLPLLVRHRVAVAVVLGVFGVLAAGVQVAKGAHFLSHVLATAWVCWGVTLLAVQIRKARSN